MTHFKKTNFYKIVIQTGVFLFILYLALKGLLDQSYTPDFEAYCPFGGLQALGSYLTRDSLSCTMTTAQIVMGLALFAGIVVFGKLFCGYICPLGTLSEWIGSMGKRLRVRFEIKGIGDKILRLPKYALLFAVFFFTLKSSELFCKKFDPYFAVASGFNSDVNLTWAAIAILLFFFGSLFFRLFWCKYLCPLGALSNLFRFSWVFGGIMGIYIVLLLFGLEITYVWPLIVLSITGYILEVVRLDRVKPNPVAITRNVDSCIDCNLCSKKCPQGIDVASLERVANIDCNLCGDCLHACPEKDTLQINGKNRKWLPAAILIFLIAVGFAISSFWELPTINVIWGNETEVSEAGVFNREGLKNIKCFGSSTAFANKMRKEKGVFGVSTYVASNAVRVYYDRTIHNDSTIEELLFVPEKKVVYAIDRDVDSVSVIKMGVDQFFDPLDVTYIYNLLKQNTKACGFITEYNCPVEVSVFFPRGEELDENELIEIIESKLLEYKVGDKLLSVKLKYDVRSISSYAILSKSDYALKMFTPIKLYFNKFSSYSQDVMERYRIPVGANYEFKSRYNHLVSHLSNDRGVVGFETLVNKSGDECIDIIFIDTISSIMQIDLALITDSLTFSYSDGRVGKMVNPFSFELKAEDTIKNNK